MRSIRPTPDHKKMVHYGARDPLVRSGITGCGGKGCEGCNFRGWLWGEVGAIWTPNIIQASPFCSNCGARIIYDSQDAGDLEGKEIKCECGEVTVL